MKYSKRFEEDWAFYLRNKDKFNFCGEDVLQWPYSIDGKTAKECFYIFDSQGKKLPSCEADLVRAILICKKSINWHIKQYAEGIADGLFVLPELITEFDNPPVWVAEAIRNQVLKIWKAKL